MGAKQSKRSVDISGKDAEGTGEVVVAGGEGRVEPLADADTLKTQLNGDATHIQSDDIIDKKVHIENGTPEKEKDVSKEKEANEVNDAEKDKDVPLTNGQENEEVKSERLEKENGESAPSPTREQETGKKGKKEKVKKKWSLRSISFSRKDKPKQEKKQKEEEPKTNGETEKLAEETQDANAVSPEVNTPEDNKNIAESKDEKTPETPVTEPITNGDSAPESPKVETPLTEEITVSSQAIEKPVEEIKVETEPGQLPVNGLSIEDIKTDVPEVRSEVKTEEIVREESTPDESPTAASEPEVPVPDSPVIIEDVVASINEKIAEVTVPDAIADIITNADPVILQETTSDVAVAN